MVASEIPGTKSPSSSQSSMVSVTNSCLELLSSPKPKLPKSPGIKSLPSKVTLPPPGKLKEKSPPPEEPPGPPPITKPKLPESEPSQLISIAPAFRFLNCSATSSFPPVPMASTIMIVAEPTTIPMEVRITLNLFCERFSQTSLKISDNFIASSLMSRIPCSQSKPYHPLKVPR